MPSRGSSRSWRCTGEGSRVSRLRGRRTGPLHPILRDEVYRIGREAVINAFRHSQANKIEIELEYSPRLARSGTRRRLRNRPRGVAPGATVTGGCRVCASGPTNRRPTSRFEQRLAGTEIELSVPGIAFPEHRDVQKRDGSSKPGSERQKPAEGRKRETK